MGAGIAGLAAGLALRQRGVNCIVLERDATAESWLQGFHYHFNVSQPLELCLADLGLQEEVEKIRNKVIAAAPAYALDLLSLPCQLHVLTAPAVQNDGHLMALTTPRCDWIAFCDGSVDLVGDIGRAELRGLLLDRCIAAGFDV